MKVLALAVSLALVCCSQAQEDLSSLNDLRCTEIGYKFPDSANLCFFWFCEYLDQAPIKVPCPKGVRVPSWWEGGELNMCNIVNIVKHGGDPVCLRCDANDVRPDDSCAQTEYPCPSECTCIDIEHTHRCDCPEELGVYGGGSVPLPVDYCSPNPCENGASCQNQWDGFFCFCPNGWTGHRCETPICDWHPCLNGGTCVVDEIGYHCECTNCWTGSCCNVTRGGANCGATPEPACQNPCFEGPNCSVRKDTCGCRLEGCASGTCVDTSYGPQCADCDACFTGAGCKTPVNSCACKKDCPINSRCEDHSDGNSYECVCNECWSGSQCDVPVVSCTCNNPCDTNQQCTMNGQQPVCGCSDPCRTGPSCADTVQTCACANPCANGATCEDSTNGPVCACGPCQDGPYCDRSIINCNCANTCNAGQSCVDSGPGQISCGCADPCLTGANCDQTVNSCACSNPCVNGGRCLDSDSGPTCQCDSCYDGPYCQNGVNNCECANPCQSGETCSMNGGAPTCGCADSCRTGPGCAELINTCECANPCTSAQECYKDGEELTCSCADPCMTGADCNIRLQTCGCSNPCQNGGLCSEAGGSLTCDNCDACFAGAYCETPVVSCGCNSPCSADQVCNMVDGAPVCGCPDCMTGDYCDVPVNSCACNNPCNNKDTCQDIGGSAQCVCDCIGNEECRTDADTNQQVCKCPLCYVNEPGQTGCRTPVNNLCVCNNPCTADQQVCVDGPTGAVPICKIGNPSSGNAFTVVFEENDSERSFREIPLELYMTPSVPNSGSRFVNIRSAGLASDHHCHFDVNMTIPQNDVLRFPVERCMMHNKTGLERLAIRMTELNNDTMLVYGINKDRWTADGFLATPDFQAGSSFQTVSYAPAHISTQFAIAALFDDTDVTIELADDNDLPAPYNTRGSVYRVTMQAFETFQVQARCPNAPKSKKRQCEKDLSGSIITANNKIHVFSGNVRAFVIAGEGLSRDHLVEEMVPTDRWGKTFGFISIPGRAVGDLLNIMALKGRATNVDMYFNGEKQSFSLPKNGRLNTYIQIPSNTRFYIKSDEPLSVTQLTKSKDTYMYNNESFHDPVTITIPPTAQFTNNFFISTPLFTGGEKFQLQPYESNLALLVAKKGDEVDITLDGAPLSDFKMPWGDLPMADGGSEALVGAVVELGHGTKLISNSRGNNFQCIVYGFDDRESYGFPAAMNQAVVN